MKALVYYGVNDFEIEDIAIESLPIDMVRIKVSSCGLCGSDIHKMFYQKPSSEYIKTKILGHEVVGVVTEINCSNSELKIGDDVVIKPFVSCYKCRECLSGNDNLCKNMLSLGRDIQGGFAEFISVPVEMVYKLPNDFELNIAPLIDSIAVGIHIINNIKVNKERLHIGIIGDGTIGLTTALIADSYKDFDVVLIGKNSKKINTAKEMGINCIDYKHITNDKKFDYVIEAVGGRQNNTINMAIQLIKKGGTILSAGVFDFGYLGGIELRTLFYKEASLKGINSYCENVKNSDFKEAILFADTYSDKLALLVTEIFGLEKFINHLRNFNVTHNSGIIKGVLKL